jgi:hypothetical protein
MDRETKIIEGVDGYNDVTAHRLPDGGIAILLSHRSTMDNAVLVRVRDETDIAFFYDDPEREALIERTNEGGPWDEVS